MDKTYFEELKGYFNNFRALPEHNIQELIEALEPHFDVVKVESVVSDETVVTIKPKKTKATKTEAE